MKNKFRKKKRNLCGLNWHKTHAYINKSIFIRKRVHNYIVCVCVYAIAWVKYTPCRYKQKHIYGWVCGARNRTKYAYLYVVVWIYAYIYVNMYIYMSMFVYMFLCIFVCISCKQICAILLRWKQLKSLVTHIIS